MTEAEYIEDQQRKQDTKWRAILRRVDRTGATTRQKRETLLANGLISFGGPRPEISCPYNCFRLTENGRALLETIEG